MKDAVGNRWVIAVAGVVMQVALGAVYAWSVFRDPLVQAFGWSIPEVTLTFSIAILMLGFAAFVGGLWLGRTRPRTVALVGGVFYGLGVIGASFAADRLWLLYLSYGVVGGIGLGLAYIVPVATLVRWFPDRRGFITGLAVAGFGAGALVTAPVATGLIQAVGVLQTFAVLGVVYLVLVIGAAMFMHNPPEGYLPAGWQPAAAQTISRTGGEYTLGQALHTWQWYALWAVLFLNVTAGISVISQAAPMAMEITGVSAMAAAGVVSLISVANGAGRLLWAWLSDAVGRKWVFLAMFLIQTVAFFVLPLNTAFAVFAALAFVVLLCYGGGFGTMPAFAADYFGEEHVGSIYGLMLTAWGLGSVPGPLVIASVRQSTGTYTAALYMLAGLMLVSALLPFILRLPRRLAAAKQTTDGSAPTRRAA
jgi:OFA family oxalate/formate antiporter-like MFS transporter